MNTMYRQLIGAALVLALLAAATARVAPASAAAATASTTAPEVGTLLKAESLKAEPYTDGKNVAPLALGTRVEILQRQGGWFRVRTAKGSGWVRMLSVRRGATGKSSVAGEAGGLLSLATGRAGTGKVVATTGIRGLHEEQLKAAKYDEAELKLVDSFGVTRTAAAQSAASAKLAARAGGYLPAPKE
jgi:SH3-like domain-containing protein